MSARLPRVAFCLFLMLSLPWHSNVNAQSGSWTGDGDGISWDDPANWDGNQVPSGAGNSASILFNVDQFAGVDVEVNSPTEIGTIGTDETNLSINADLQTDLNFAGGELNLNSGTLTGSLDLRMGDFFFNTPTINRNGGLLDLDSLQVATSSSDNITLVAGDMVRSTFFDSDGGVLTVDGAEVENVDLSTGVVNVNSGTVSGDTQITGLFSPTIFNFNGGTLSGNLFLNDIFGAAEFNRTGGVLDLESLSIFAEDFQVPEITIVTGDSVNDSISNFGGRVIIDASLSLSTLSASRGLLNSTGELVLNNDITAETVSLEGGAVITRANNASIQTDELRVSSSSNYVFDGQDTITSGGSLTALRSGAKIVIASSINDVSLFAEGSSFGSSAGGTIDVDAASNFNSVVATQRSTINLNESSTGDFEINEGSTLNLNNTTLTGSLTLEDSTLNRSQDSKLVLLDFSIAGGGTVAIREGDQVSESLSVSSGAEVDVFSILDLDSIRLADGAVLNLFHEMGQDDFLSTDSLEFVGQDSILNLFFDEQELDFRDLALGIRISGDQTTELQGLVDAGQIRASGVPGLLGVFRDVQGFGDYTFVGVVGVPEPSSACLLVGVFGIFGCRRRRTS